MQAYGELFARVYNQKWQGYANRIAPLIHEFYESTAIGQDEKTLLDICCGTGQLLGHFLNHGYHVVGLDLSEGMLTVARQKLLPYIIAEQARFIHGDAAYFEIQDRFGLVVSTYDSLNHLSDTDALQGCFQSASKVIKKGGYFIFDLNTAAGLENWNSLSIDPGDEFFTLNRGIFDKHEEKAWTRITGFVRNSEGLYQRFEQTVYNTVFDMEEVKETLLQSGFSSAYFASGMNLETPIVDPEKHGKVFFVATK